MQKYFIIFLLTIWFPSNIYASDYNIFSDEEEIEQSNDLYDPFEKFNRRIYKFNMTLDKYTLKPAAKTYRKIVPSPVRNSIGNALDNLTVPLTFVNSLLQLDFKNSGKSVLRFSINSTIGLLGFFDVAQKMNIKINKEDFGQTLAKYNVPNGPFFMVPFLGPFTLRSLSGTGIGWAADPFWSNVSDNQENRNIRYSLTALSVINARESIYDELEDIEKNTLDPYSVIKSAYIQKRESLVKNE